ncbi:hypothetical protein HBP72_12735 [Listeria welshimeri]|uniref:Uncharacterized protein n=1 Tax=Listeria welshimeri TaxID=1643 RepID=A0A7X0T9F1_LISWE|nr:hypothetical protein [Listeria welshimeri]MBC1244624.1 hypothetical protein [Listeria welshimeri]MBC1250887.1 hypothetical protein [Listeria welshimeri]MBC1283348.1 hypothetical protein [Listeria welshimeri]MBC1289873.1 hypothetical protein [Listeria welshimeri]MBC1319915.1 hypothetical protein [Listeria welshimeri]
MKADKENRLKSRTLADFKRFFITLKKTQTIFDKKVKKNIIKIADSNRQMLDLLISF